MSKRRFTIPAKKPLQNMTKRELIDTILEMDRMLQFLELQNIKYYTSKLVWRYCLKEEMKKADTEDEILELIEDSDFFDEPVPRKPPASIGYC